MEKAFFKKIRNEISQELKGAKVSIKVAVAWFTNHDLFDELCNKLKNDVSVELIIINDFINNRYGGLDFNRFIKLGGKLYFSKIEEPVHNKFCIIDDQTLISGSYNWTYFAESINLENVIIFKENKNLIAQFEEEFNNIKSTLNKLNKVVPLSIEMVANYDIYSAKQYLSKDYYQFALSEEIKGNDKLALDLVNKSIEFDNGNSLLIKASEEISKKIKQKSENDELEAKLKVERERNLQRLENEESIKNAAEQREDLRKEQASREEQEKIQLQNFQSKVFLESAEKWKKKGNLEYCQKKYDDAFSSYEKAIELKIDFAPAYLGIAEVFWRKSEFEKMIAFANKAIQYKLDKLENAYNSLGIAYAYKMDYKKSIEYYDKAIELDTECYWLYFNKGLVINKLGDKISEKACNIKCIELCTKRLLIEVEEKKQINNYAIRGNAKELTGDYDGAKIDYLKAKELYEVAKSENKDLHDFERIAKGINSCNFKISLNNSILQSLK